MWNSLWSIYDGGTTASEADISAQRTAAGSTNNLQTSLHSTASTSNSSGSSRYHTQQPMVKSSAVDNTTVIRGLIVGERQSGKSSLIIRLRGDPFVDREDEDSRNNNNTQANKPKRNVMALIPWKIPKKHHAYILSPTQLR